MVAFEKLFQFASGYDDVSCPAWFSRYKDNKFVELLRFYLSKRISRQRVIILSREIQEWIRTIRFLPKIGNGGVWDMVNVIHVKEYFGILPTTVGIKRKAPESRTLALSALPDFVPSNFSFVLDVYKTEYYPAAKKFWSNTVPTIEFPLEKDPTTDAMKALILFSCIHTLLQLGKKDANYYPFYTLPPPKGKQTPKHFQNAAYFSKFIVFIIYNRSKAGRNGWNYSFLKGNAPMQAKYAFYNLDFLHV